MASGFARASGRSHPEDPKAKRRAAVLNFA
jgi:hypothetical protein